MSDKTLSGQTRRTLETRMAATTLVSCRPGFRVGGMALCRGKAFCLATTRPGARSKTRHALALVAALMLCPGSLSPAQYFAAPNGNDQWSGTSPIPNAQKSQGPLRTLARARDLARLGAKRGEPTTIHLAGGTYPLTETLELSLEDSGSAEAPVTWQSAEGQRALITGSVTVSPHWRLERGAIYRADLTGTPAAGHAFNQMYHRGNLMVLARYPNFISNFEVSDSWLYVRDDQVMKLAVGLAQTGDFMEYDVTVPNPGLYTFHAAYATTFTGMEQVVSFRIRGQVLPMGVMPVSAGWRDIAWAHSGEISLPAGKFVLRVENQSATAKRIHLGTMVFTDKPGGAAPFTEPKPGENRVVLAGHKASRLKTSIQPFLIVSTDPPEKSNHKLWVFPRDLEAAWAGLQGVQMNLFADQGWFNEIVSVDQIDAGTGLVQISGHEAQGMIKVGNRFFLENLGCELDAPGEWFYEADTHTLRFWPPDGKTPGEVQFPILSTLIRASAPTAGGARVGYLQFKNLDFAQARYTPNHLANRTAHEAMLKMENVKNSTVTHCRFGQGGGYAIWLHLDATGNSLTQNVISNMGGGGVLMTGARMGWGDRGQILTDDPASQDLAPIQNDVSQNLIHHCGLIYKYIAGVYMDSRPASMARGPGNRIVSNHIYAMSRLGVFGFLNQGGHDISWNYIHEVLKECDDGGGIHICANTPATAPTRITHNTLVDLAGIAFKGTREFIREKGFGIYMDNYTSHVLISDNVVNHSFGGAIHLHGGEDITVTHNILGDDGPTAILLNEMPNPPGAPISISGNILSLPTPGGSFYWASPKYVDLKITQNLYHDPTGLQTFNQSNFTQWQGAGRDLQGRVMGQASPFGPKTELPGLLPLGHWLGFAPLVLYLPEGRPSPASPVKSP